MPDAPNYRRPMPAGPALPLIYPDDGPEFYELIKELIRLKYFVRRPSKHHIKHKEINFWPSTGTITIDVAGRHPEKGQQAFLALLKKMYPKRPLRDLGAEAVIEESPPSPLVLEIDLDDQEETSCNHVRKEDSDGGVPW